MDEFAERDEDEGLGIGKRAEANSISIAGSALDLIGNTPLVRIGKLAPKDSATILAKLERQNIGGSIKDRIAKCMVEEAEKRGLLAKGMTIIEATSGNTGIGLAVVAAVKGYEAVFVMPASASQERILTMRALGAGIVLTDAALGTDGAIAKAHEMADGEPDRYFMTNQFENWCNPHAHYETTGREIIEQTGGSIDAVVIAMGTTGTLMGVARRMKGYDEGIKIIAVEPMPGHRIQGMKNLEESAVPGIYEPMLVDEKVNVRDEDAFEAARRMAREEGLLVGMSSGAVMHVALAKAKELGTGKIVVAVLPDGGERYLSTGLFK